MSKGIFLLVVSGVLGFYLFVAYCVSVNNTINMTCPHNEHLVLNPWTLAATGSCSL